MRYSGSLRFAAVGGLLFAGIVHPFTMVAYYVQYLSSASAFGDHPSMGASIQIFAPTMLAMTGAYAVLGDLLGLIFGSNMTRQAHGEMSRRVRDRLLGSRLRQVIDSGEGSDMEFKSTLRWDVETLSVNRDLEAVVVKSLCGFMNSGGGTLLLGVRDDGSVSGLESDYRTLNRSDHDGFERHLLQLVAARLGADLCPAVEVRFSTLSGQEVAVVYVSAARRPVYVTNGNAREYYVRTGNSTRALNTQEAVEHVRARLKGI